MFICFPVGQGGSGWRILAEGLISVAGVSQSVALEAQASQNRNNSVPINTTRTFGEVARMCMSAADGG